MRWEEEEGALRARLSFKSYLDAFAFVQKMAQHAEGVNHHPTLCWDYDELNILLTTKDKGNTVTPLDREFALWIDSVYPI